MPHARDEFLGALLGPMSIPRQLVVFAVTFLCPKDSFSYALTGVYIFFLSSIIFDASIGALIDEVAEVAKTPIWLLAFKAR